MFNLLFLGLILYCLYEIEKIRNKVGKKEFKDIVFSSAKTSNIDGINVIGYLGTMFGCFWFMKENTIIGTVCLVASWLFVQFHVKKNIKLALSQINFLRESPAPLPTPMLRKTIPNAKDCADFQEIIDKFGKDGIALVMPFPVLLKDKCRSKIGGLPSLPPSKTWPRTSLDKRVEPNAPLHFVAQIDLAEMPCLEDSMPKRGTLLFFARLDEEMIWGEDTDNPHDDVCVIFDENSNGVPTKPPEDTLPIFNYKIRGFKDFENKNFSDEVSFVEWPLKAYTIKTIPDYSAIPRDLLPENGGELYDLCHVKFRAEQISKAIGCEIPTQTYSPFPFGMIHDPITQKAIIDTYENIKFPYCAAGIYLAARYLTENIRANDDAATAFKKRLETTIEKFDQSSIYKPIDSLGANKFISFINEYINTRTNNDFHQISGVISFVGNYLLNCAASDEKIARLLPDQLFEREKLQFSAIGKVIRESDGAVSHYFAKFHQMLGFTTSTQHQKPYDSTLKCLFQLDSMYEKGLMFCDCGEAEFWIESDNLRQRDFDSVIGYTCGG